MSESARPSDMDRKDPSRVRKSPSHQTWWTPQGYGSKFNGSRPRCRCETGNIKRSGPARYAGQYFSSTPGRGAWGFLKDFMSNANESTFIPVPGWPQYEVSSDGVVRSWFIGGTRGQRRRVPNYKKIKPAKDGYLRVTFHEKRKGCKTKVETFSVHRLVAMCFLDGDSTLDVAHIDGDKTNNHISNLKWCTKAENESHKLVHGTKAQGSKNGQSKLCERSVVAIRKLFKENKWNQKQIAVLFQVSQQNVHAIVSGKSWRQI